MWHIIKKSNSINNVSGKEIVEKKYEGVFWLILPVVADILVLNLFVWIHFRLVNCHFIYLACILLSLEH